VAAGVALGAAACGTVLGLDGYGDATDGGQDASAMGQLDGGGGQNDATPESGLPETAAGGDEVLLDVVVPGTDDATGGDGDVDAPVDAPMDAPADTPEPFDALPASYTPPPGWTLVAFAASQQTPCPPGFAGPATDVVFDTSTATTPAGTCTCDSCSVTAPPSCVTGSISGGYDYTGGRCNISTPTLGNANPGGCNTDNPHYALGNLDIYFDPLPPSGGSCTAAATPHPSQVTFSGKGEICSVNVDAGTPLVMSPFLECIAKPGMSPCPPGPLNVPHQVGAGATITCAGSCTCSTTATCTGGTVTYYQSSNCTGSTTLVMPAGGSSQCNSVAGGNVSYGSNKYTATVTNPACTFGGTSAATVTGLTAGQTVCCQQ
jgi:hypothetical protein